MGLPPLSSPCIMYTKDLLQQTNITKDTLRHYNEIGLLKPHTNPTNNYKMYSQKDVETILFIKKAKKIGFTLNEIKKIIVQMQSATCKHQSLIPYLEDQLEEINDKIIILKKMKSHISFLINDFKKRDCEVTPTKLEM